MYISVRRPLAPPGSPRERPLRSRAAGRLASPTVVLLGVTSLLTDVASELVAAVLPLYLTLHLGLSPLQFGVVDGLYQGVTAAVRLAAGRIADLTRRPKAVAVVGYGLSTVSKLAYLPVSSALEVSAVIAVDRSGKGIRTAPRDAMIAAATPPEGLGAAFGVHRALDTVGALTGPLLAFGILAALPGAYDAVFVVSTCFAVLGLAVLVLFVRDPVARAGPLPVPPLVRHGVARLLTDRRVGRILSAAGLLALLTISDSFVYLLLLNRGDLSPALVPLLFVATSCTYLALAVPLGRLADRAGRVRVFLAGHLILPLAYAAILAPLPMAAVVAVSLGLLGAYYAATDGVLAAVTASLVPSDLRSSGLALVQTIVVLGKFASAVGFGAVWTLIGPRTALLGFLTGLLLAVVVAAVLLRGAATSRADSGPGRPSNER